jgi:succinate dehydrogenase/fumarate reductase flavoprotein subunit
MIRTRAADAAVDVIVVGRGGAGLGAAITAHDLGAEVVVP